MDPRRRVGARRSGLDAPGDRPVVAGGAPRSRRCGYLLVHLLAETAHHAGHADIVREAIDGRAGGDHDELGDAEYWKRLRGQDPGRGRRPPDPRWLRSERASVSRPQIGRATDASRRDRMTRFTPVNWKPPLLDVVIAAAFVAMTVAEAVFSPKVASPVEHVVVAGLAMAALAWRRRAPLVVAATRDRLQPRR